MGRRGLRCRGRIGPFQGLDSIQKECKPWAENADKFGGEGEGSFHAPHDELANTTRCFAPGWSAVADCVVTLVEISRNVLKNELSQLAGLAVGANSAAAPRGFTRWGRRLITSVHAPLRLGARGCEPAALPGGGCSERVHFSPHGSAVDVVRKQQTRRGLAWGERTSRPRFQGDF